MAVMTIEAEATPDPGGASASVTAQGYSALLSRLRLAELVEFSVAYASEKGVPFIRRESENRPLGIPAVTDPDLVAG